MRLLALLPLLGGCHVVLPLQNAPLDTAAGDSVSVRDLGVDGPETGGAEAGLAEAGGPGLDGGLDSGGDLDGGNDGGWIRVVHNQGSNNLTGIWAGTASSGLTEVWAVGDTGTILHYDGAGWSTEPSGTSANLSAVWGAGASDIWAVGMNVTLRRSGGVWGPAGKSGEPLSAVWGRGSSDVWIGGANLFRYDGTWDQQLDPAGVDVKAGWADPGGDNWLANSSGIFRSTDDLSWSSTSTTGAILALSGCGSEVWAAGSTGLVLQWKGAKPWIKHGAPTSGYRGVWASPSCADVWVVGNGGAVVHYDGQGWSPETVPTANNLTSIWGTSSGELWVAGNSGTILHRR